MGYFLFILLNATLFLRPAELFPALGAAPIYFYLILSCLAFSLPQVFQQLSPQALTRNPITVCMFGLLVAVFMSHASHMDLWNARMKGFDFAKIVLYYLLLVGHVKSENRLKNFLRWLVFLITTEASLALLVEFGVIHLAGMEMLDREFGMTRGGEFTFVRQLQGTGIFNDPNDLAMILVAGIVLCLGLISDKQASSGRIFWIIPLMIMFVAFAMTRSRGGFIALTAGLGTLSLYKRGPFKTAVLAVVVVPVMLVAFGGRMTSFNEGMDDGTGMKRLQLWSDSFMEMRRAPLFGIGSGTIHEEIRQVSHNSYIQAYAELGLFGGTFFVGAFIASFMVFNKLRKQKGLNQTKGLIQITPTMAALIAGAGASMMSISRNYTLTTYCLLGLTAAFCQISSVKLRMPVIRFDPRFVMMRLAPGGVCALISLYVLTRVMVRF